MKSRERGNKGRPGVKARFITYSLGISLAAVTAVHAQSHSSSPSGDAREFSSDELNRRNMERRAVEAVIWGMPAVNYERMLQAATDNGAKLNQVVFWSRPVNEKNQTLTPNPDTIYFNPFYDTSKGPVVVEIPPADADYVIVGSMSENSCERSDHTEARVAEGNSPKRFS
jgi:hypothetical protein